MVLKDFENILNISSSGMAAGPADAFSATPRGFGCYDRELLPDNLWSSSVVATASTGASWVDEVHNSDSLEKRLEDLKRKFHRGRVLQIKHLPRSNGRGKYCCSLLNPFVNHGTLGHHLILQKKDKSVFLG